MWHNKVGALLDAKSLPPRTDLSETCAGMVRHGVGKREMLARAEEAETEEEAATAEAVRLVAEAMGPEVVKMVAVARAAALTAAAEEERRWRCMGSG